MSFSGWANTHARICHSVVRGLIRGEGLGSPLPGSGATMTLPTGPATAQPELLITLVSAAVVRSEPEPVVKDRLAPRLLLTGRRCPDSQLLRVRDSLLALHLDPVVRRPPVPGRPGPRSAVA